MTCTQLLACWLNWLSAAPEFDAEVKSLNPVHWSLNFFAFFSQLQKYFAPITRMTFFHLIPHPTVPDFDIIIIF